MGHFELRDPHQPIYIRHELAEMELLSCTFFPAFFSCVCVFLYASVICSWLLTCTFSTFVCDINCQACKSIQFLVLRCRTPTRGGSLDPAGVFILNSILPPRFRICPWKQNLHQLGPTMKHYCCSGFCWDTRVTNCPGMAGTVPGVCPASWAEAIRDN